MGSIARIRFIVLPAHCVAALRLLRVNMALIIELIILILGRCQNADEEASQLFAMAVTRRFAQVQ